MRQYVRAIRSDDRGSILIDSPITLIILLLLTGFAAFAVNTLYAEATETSCRADVRTVEQAAAVYYLKTGAFAVDPDGAGNKTAIDVLVDDGYLPSNPNSDRYAVTLIDGTATGSNC